MDITCFLCLRCLSWCCKIGISTGSGNWNNAAALQLLAVAWNDMIWLDLHWNTEAYAAAPPVCFCGLLSCWKMETDGSSRPDYRKSASWRTQTSNNKLDPSQTLFPAGHQWWWLPLPGLSTSTVPFFWKKQIWLHFTRKNLACWPFSDHSKGILP